LGSILVRKKKNRKRGKGWWDWGRRSSLEEQWESVGDVASFQPALVAMVGEGSSDKQPTVSSRHWLEEEHHNFMTSPPDRTKPSPVLSFLIKS